MRWRNFARCCAAAPPFGPLKLRALNCVTTTDAVSAAAFAADAELQASGNSTPEADQRAQGASRHDGTRQAFLPLLARLIRGGLEHLEVFPDDDGSLDLFSDDADVADFAAACHASTTLQKLVLNASRSFEAQSDADGAHCVALLAALTGHPTLRQLDLSYYQPHPAAAAHVGAALGALIAANAPALRELDLCGCALGDAGLSAVADALPRNTHLHLMDLAGNVPTVDFVAGALARGVCANTTLARLCIRNPPGESYLNADEEADELQVFLERIVAIRRRAAAGVGL